VFPVRYGPSFLPIECICVPYGSLISSSSSSFFLLFIRKGRFEVLLTVTMKSTTFCGVTRYSQVEACRRFGGTYCLKLWSKMDAV
jgi:hypothetical protein